MPAQPECPYCNAKLFPHELGNDECGTCGRRLSTATGWTPPAPEGPLGPIDERLVLPHRPPPEAFATVRQGVAVIWWGLLYVLAVGVLGALVLFAAIATQALWLRNIACLGAVFAGFGVLAVFVGVCCCCAVPRGCEAVRWARRLTASLVAGTTFALVFGADLVHHFASPGGTGPTWLDVAAGVAFFLALGIGAFGWLCWSQLTAELARLFDDWRLARGLGVHLVSTLCGVSVGVLGGCVALAATIDARAAGDYLTLPIILLVVWLLPGVGLGAWLLFLLTRLHSVIPAPGQSERRRQYGRGRWD